MAARVPSVRSVCRFADGSLPLRRQADDFELRLPVSARYTRLFSPISRNFDKSVPAEDTIKFNLQVFQEDADMVELQTPEDLPLDLLAEAHIPADRTSIAYRQLLTDLGLGRSYTS